MFAIATATVFLYLRRQRRAQPIAMYAQLTQNKGENAVATTAAVLESDTADVKAPRLPSHRPGKQTARQQERNTVPLGAALARRAPKKTAGPMNTPDFKPHVGFRASKTPLDEVLKRLRDFDRVSGASFGSHQANAHLNLAYTLGVDAEPWELYRLASLFSLPRTAFFIENTNDVITGIEKTGLCHGFLAKHGKLKQEFAAELKALGLTKFASTAAWSKSIIYYDPDGYWAEVRGVNVPWYDTREREIAVIVEGSDWMTLRLRRNMDRLAERAKAAPKESQRTRAAEELERLMRYLKGDLYRQRVAQEKEQWEKRLQYVALLERTADFNKELFNLLRKGENIARAAQGVPNVGEGWVSETALVYRLRSLMAPAEVVHHAKLPWLGAQHLDVFVPSLSLAFEYQGEQHFKAIDFFGGERALTATKARDQRKRDLCAANGVRLVEIRYDADIDDALLRSYCSNPGT
jgi:hypothetical protein